MEELLMVACLSCSSCFLSTSLFVFFPPFSFQRTQLGQLLRLAGGVPHSMERKTFYSVINSKQSKHILSFLAMTLLESRQDCQMDGVWAHLN